ncbi:filamentous hemagglutinin N-terminal domain-containing protein [Salmonella enterica]|nr:filamentous hemagglutinin N-terminal domain-containing protein [Salmonella enterica]EFT9441162.1 filamentous hemagglutinin N-terminal domain-containing protein [Salmonella enterica]EFV1301455.1 filamentous hemagglutinin N-terminal domain-containing protein [Salmonella enterica]
MNKIYRLKFDKRRNELVVVSEIAAGTGKKKNTGHIADLCDVSTFRKLVGTLTPLAFLTGLIISLFPVVALANPDLPTGGQIVGGQGSISTSGNQMTIHQQTQNMATNWQSFDIGKNNTVRFVQPDSSSVALNRVTGASGSQIMGTLKANGQVFILNPNGVLFGKDARVNVAGLVASTKNINTADFMKGQYTLSGEGNPGAQVINQGSLTTTKGGYIVLAADQVKNSGTITTPSGKTVLAAGKTVTLQLDNGGLTSVSVDGSVVNALVENQGLISAADGRVFLTAQGKDMLLNTVVNNSGTIEAKGLESRGGEIVLNGGDSGVVNQSGQLLADSHAGPGGKITVEGQNIHLAANSRTSATGKTGGGEVYVGGGWQGKDSHIRNASKVVMDKTATVDVSATDAGNGGTAVLWSDDYTNFRGAILAKGGALSGDGGRVETSSHNNLQASGDVDTSASAGKGGEWLLDPADVVIDDGGDIGTYSENDSVFTPKADIAHISTASIQEQLNKGGSVTVRTSGFGGNRPGDIVIDGSIHKTGGDDATLTLVADRGIMINAVSAGKDENKSIDSTKGKLNIKLLAGGSSEGAVFLGGKFDTHGGDFSISAVTYENGNNAGQAKNHVAVRVKGFADINTGAGNFTIDKMFYIDTSHLKELYMVKGYKGGEGFYTGFSEGNRGQTDYLDGINIWGKITSGGDINLQSNQIFMGKGSSLVGKTIDIKSSDNLFGTYGDAGVLFEKAYIEATGGNINIQSKGLGSGIELAGGKEKPTIMKALGDIILEGISNNSANSFGVKVNNSTFEAKHLEVKGVSKQKGTGFTLTNITLAGGMTWKNVTLSSAGSAISVTNRLDRSIVTDTERNEILTQWHPENITYIDMDGKTIFDDAQGWEANYSSDSELYGGWAFDNTTVNAGGDVTLQGVGFINSTVTVNHGNLKITNGGPVLLNGSTVDVKEGTVDVRSGEGSISLNSVQKGGKVNKGSITAKGSISLTADKGFVHVIGGDGESDRSSITSAEGNISVKAVCGNQQACNGSGISLQKSTLTATSGKITLDGTSEWNSDKASGVKVENSTLDAQSLEVKGVSTKQGAGFALTNLTLKGGLVNTKNVTLSSAGSAAGVINRLDRGIVNSFGYESILDNWHPENMTQIDMGGDALFDDHPKGWTADYSKDNAPNGGWIFDNTTVNAGGDVELQGVGFTNSTVTVNHGNLKITNGGPVLLNGSTVKVNGTVDIQSSEAGISLNGVNKGTEEKPVVHKGSISAKGNISLTATKGPVQVVGFNDDNRNEIISETGSVSVIAGGGDTAVKLVRTDVSALKGNITVDGKTEGKYSGVRFIHVNMAASTETGQINVTAESTGIFDDYREYGSLYFGSGNNFAANSMNFEGRNLGGYIGSGVAFVDENDVFKGNADSTFKGNVNISGTGGRGISFRSTSLNFEDGHVGIKGVSDKAYEKVNGFQGAGAIYFDGINGYNSVRVDVALKNADLIMEADSTGAQFPTSGGVGAFAISGVQADTYLVPGIKFSGDGNVEVIGKSRQGTGVDSRYFDNMDFEGNFKINGVSESGEGVNLDSKLNVHLHDAIIYGKSESSAGVNIVTGDGEGVEVNLGNNTITGESDTGAGIVINGKNITIKDGTLKGTSASGEEPGVSLVGGDNYVFDNVNVEGESENGDGVSVRGALKMNNGTYVQGKSSGKGAGVSVAGELTTTEGEGVTLMGQSESGDGVQVAGTLKDATVNGKSGSGIGANISGGIDGGEVTGDSESGDGVVLAQGADVHKAVVKGSSTTGRGVYVADPDVKLADSTVEGHSEKGTGVQLNASMSGGRLTATSVEGTGLQVEKDSSAENVVISAQTVTGKAIKGENNALDAKGDTSISTVGEPGNINISENAKPVPGGTPSGAVAEVLGNKLSESIAALQKTLDTKLAGLDGLQQTMTTLQMQFDQAVRTGAIGQVDLKRLETAMNGLSDRLNTAAELKDAFGALKTDTGSLEERLKKSDVLSAEIQGLTLPAGGDISAVTAELGAAKALQSATVSLQASLAARTEENGKVRLRLDSLKQRLKEAQEKGTAGGAVLAEMQTQLEGLERQQRSYGESLVHFQQSLATVSQDGSRPVTSRQESVDRLQTALSGVSGISDMQVSTLGEQLQQAMTGYAQVVVTAQGQGGVNAQTSLQNRDQQDGFRAGGEPPVPVRGYQTQPQSVDIHLCDSDRCRLITLDVGKPSQVAMAEVTESRPDGK